MFHLHLLLFMSWLYIYKLVILILIDQKSCLHFLNDKLYRNNPSVLTALIYLSQRSCLLEVLGKILLPPMLAYPTVAHFHKHLRVTSLYLSRYVLRVDTICTRKYFRD